VRVLDSGTREGSGNVAGRLSLALRLRSASLEPARELGHGVAAALVSEGLGERRASEVDGVAAKAAAAVCAPQIFHSHSRSTGAIAPR